MHNYWIAALEYFGLITHEQAEHISKEVRMGIHKENYIEALRDFQAIMDSQKGEKLPPVIHKLKTDVSALNSKVLGANIKAHSDLPLAQNSKSK